MCSSVVDAMLKHFLNPEMIFVNPVAKYSRHMTDLYVNAHKTALYMFLQHTIRI